MEDRRRFGFDPDSGPARHLAQAARSRELIQIELTQRMSPADARQIDPRLLPGRTYEPGDRIVKAAFALGGVPAPERANGGRNFSASA